MLTPEQEAEAERRQHFVLKQLVFFWPMVSNGDDADRVEHLNYWLCVSYAWWNLLSGLLSIFLLHVTPASPIPILLVILIGLFYFLGGNAVRQNSVVAAWGLAGYTAIPVVEAFLRHQFNGDLFLFFLGSLVVLRGTFLTARWRKTEAAATVPLRLAELLPFQFSTGLSRTFSDRLPPLLWPRLQWLFWLTASGLIAEPLFLAYLLLPQSARPEAKP